MLALDPAPVGEAAVAIASPTLAVGSLATLGLLGVTDWILGDDEPPESSEQPSGDGGSGMFDEPETAGDGGIAGGDGGDEFAFDDGDDDEAFDEFDVGGMDEEGGGGGGAQVRELETRMEELEDEVSSISSTVSTVRTENEQISESVDDIEENVRKLLDIYKMVTKGVNPFVDEDGGGGGGGFAGADGSSLGLFDQDDEDEEEAENLDQDVTDADAEEFFDDDFEDEEEPEADEAGAQEGEDEAEADAEASEESMAQSDDAPTDEEGGAKSFDELREEYEEGAEWSEADEEEADTDDDAETEVEAVEESAEEETEAEDVEVESEPEDDEAPVDDDRVDGLFDGQEVAGADDAAAQQPTPQPAARPSPQAPPRDGARQPVGGAAGEKPYLRQLPSGYVSDLLVMEWVEFLVTESSPSGAHRAITYYENVGWVGHRAADQLREFVDGHPEGVADDDAEESDALTMDHHTTSLRYVARITGDVQENVLASWDDGDNRWL